MSPDQSPATAETTTVTFTPETFARIAEDAKHYGLSPQSYLTALSAIQAGRVPPDTLRTLGEIYRHDRETLRELAK